MVPAFTGGTAANGDDAERAVNGLQDRMAHEIPRIREMIRDERRMEEHRRGADHPADEETVDEGLMIRHDQELRTQSRPSAEPHGAVQEAEDDSRECDRQSDHGIGQTGVE